MKNSRDVFGGKVQETGTSCQGVQTGPSGQNRFKLEAPGQELSIPRWRGPFEGYR